MDQVPSATTMAANESVEKDSQEIVTQKLSTLSTSEWNVLSKIALGMVNKAIGRELGITEATVKVHAKAINRKLGVNSRVKAALLAFHQDMGTYGADRDVERLKEAVKGLTLREKDTLGRIGLAEQNKEIARSLGVAQSTVKQMVKAILRKLRAENRTQLALLAARLGLPTYGASKTSPAT